MKRNAMTKAIVIMKKINHFQILNNKIKNKNYRTIYQIATIIYS